MTASLVHGRRHGNRGFRRLRGAERHAFVRTGRDTESKLITVVVNKRRSQRIQRDVLRRALVAEQASSLGVPAGLGTIENDDGLSISGIDSVRERRRWEADRLLRRWPILPGPGKHRRGQATAAHRRIACHDAEHAGRTTRRTRPMSRSKSTRIGSPESLLA